MSPAAATATATATTAGADNAAQEGGSAKGKAQRDAGKGRLLDMKLGTWNVQALGWGLLQMDELLGRGGRGVQTPNRACASTSKTKDNPKRHGSTAREPNRRRRAW